MDLQSQLVEQLRAENRQLKSRLWACRNILYDLLKMLSEDEAVHNAYDLLEEAANKPLEISGNKIDEEVYAIQCRMVAKWARRWSAGVR